MKNLPFLKGMTYYFTAEDEKKLGKDVIISSFKKMAQETKINAVALAFPNYIKNTHDDDLDPYSPYLVSNDLLISLIKEAHKEGLFVLLKPMLNTLNGEWRAYINFLDSEELCEPKWSVFFTNYEKYLARYAVIAEKNKVEMLLVGCELVSCERKTSNWHHLITSLRLVYHGLLSYNADKYDEENVHYWESCDAISSSAYYPEKSLNDNLDRVQLLCDKFDKTYFMAEAGCPSRMGSEKIPNDWTHIGSYSEETQYNYFFSLFASIRNHPFVCGFFIWDYTPSDFLSTKDDGYSRHDKKALKLLSNFAIE